MSDWHRLSARVVWMDLARLLISLIPGYAGIVWFGDDGPVWPLVIGSAFGVLGAIGDFVRYLTTRYRVTATLVEVRGGWPARRHRTVARELIRSVDVSAKARHRPFRLRVVHIGSGEAESSFQLDALDQAHAERLRQELLRPGVATGDDEAPEPVGTPIARFRRHWIALNSFTFWSPLVVLGPFFGLYWILRAFGVDLLNIAALRQGPVLAIVAVAVVLLGFAGTAITFVLEYWNFELVRTGTALVSRRGLISTRTVQFDDRRMRGLTLKEPLVWRWLRLADTQVVTTGLRGGVEPASAILPRMPRPEALDLAAQILPDGAAPMSVPLHRHPRGALLRRLGWAVWIPGLVSAALWLWGLTGALPTWVWPLPLLVIPITLVLAVAAYRSLGHALTDDYLVMRRGGLNRHTVALQQRAVIGWSLTQSILQRRGDRITVVAATAAGERHYSAPDAGTAQAVALAFGATPALVAPFLKSVPEPADAHP